MANEVSVTTRLDGFDDPLLGYVSFEQFDDPLLGLEKMRRAGKVSGSAESQPNRNNLQMFQIPERIVMKVQYREPNVVLSTFKDKRQVDAHTRKVEDGYEVTFVPR